MEERDLEDIQDYITNPRRSSDGIVQCIYETALGTIFGDGCHRSDRCGDPYHQESEKEMNAAVAAKCGIQGNGIIDQEIEEA